MGQRFIVKEAPLDVIDFDLETSLCNSLTINYPFHVTEKVL